MSPNIMAATTTEIEPVREIALPGSTPTENGETVDSKSHPPGLTLFDGIEDSNDASTAEDQYPTGAKFYTICLSLGLVIILGALDATIVATAVPSITDHFHTIVRIMIGRTAGSYFGYPLIIMPMALRRTLVGT